MDGNDQPISLSIRKAEDLDSNAWDAYVAAHSEGEFFHRFGWGRVIERAYGYESHFFMAMRAEKIVGILPLIDVRAPLLGRSLISTAFTVGGGLLCDDNAVGAALLDKAEALGRTLSVKYIELRSGTALGSAWSSVTDRHAGFAMDLPASEDDNLKAIPRKRRAEVRKAIKAHGAGEISLRHEIAPDLFYPIYAASLREHGTPVFSKRFLNALIAEFEDDIDMFFVETDGAPIVALLNFKYKKKYLPYYIGALHSARACRGSEFVFWVSMRHAAEAGYQVFDFGRSKMDTGPFAFKRLWGIEPEMLTYHYCLLSASELPNVSPKNPKFQMFTKVWRQLPAPVTNQLGPLLAANFA